MGVRRMSPHPIRPLDPVRTLDPSSGLVSESSVYVPNNVGLWRTVGVLAGAKASGFAGAVGAFDINKRASMTRGAGEAVERFALIPKQADDVHLLVHQAALEKRIDFVTAGLGRASALAYELPWYRAADLTTGKETHVPAPLVDYAPKVTSAAGAANLWDPFFDPSPNGAASGPSEEFAQLAGISEVLERDAFLSAWRQQAPLQVVDVPDLPDTPDAAGLLKLLAAANAVGVMPTLAFVPTEGSPLVTAVCIITQTSGSRPFAAVGLKASPDPLRALMGALQEGLQIRELFLARTPAAVSPTAVTDDDTRAEFWTTPAAISAMREWIRSFVPAPLPGQHPASTVTTLVQHLAQRSIPALWVSLTHRLPDHIRGMGWVAGKAICPGAVPLTMDETKGLPGPGQSPIPHPLI